MIERMAGQSRIEKAIRKTFRHGGLGLFWASYVKTLEVSIFFSIP